MLPYKACPQCESPTQFGELCEGCIGYNDPACLDSADDFQEDF